MTRISKDWIGTYFDKGVDYANRRLYLIGDLEEELLKNFVHGIKLLEAASTDPIEVYISTNGGDLYDMFGIYDVLRASKCHVKTISFGKIMSGGIIVSAAGDERVCHPHTVFLSHEMKLIGGTEFLTAYKNEIKHLEIMRNNMIQCLVVRSHTPASKWAKYIRGLDFYFDAVQAQELGIVDKIIMPE
jgi:ATP-dependent Clp protease protease subunit